MMVPASSIIASAGNIVLLVIVMAVIAALAVAFVLDATLARRYAERLYGRELSGAKFFLAFAIGGGVALITIVLLDLWVY